MNSCNGFLSYKWSDSPLGEYKMGGDISFNGGEVIKGPDGNGIMTYQWGNNHGSLMKVKDQWYIFYHRQTGCNEYSRQAMVEPVDIAMGKNGQIFIGKIRYDETGEPAGSDVVECTSQGFNLGGLDAYSLISAGYTCHMYDGLGKPMYQDNAEGTNKDKRVAHVQPVYEGDSSPVVDIQSGATIGFKYINFGDAGASSATLTGEIPAGFEIKIRIGSYDGEIVADKTVSEDSKEVVFGLDKKITGRHAVYFEFTCKDDDKRALFDTFTFD